jgi:hypothetical protein
MRDSSLKVTETIKYDFGRVRKHGIYRQIPQSYTCADGTNALHIEYLDAQMDGKPVMMVPELSKGFFEARLGQADRQLTGVHKYVLKYQVYNAVGFVKGRPEVYWNVTGNQWAVPVNHASAGISTQAGASPAQFSSYFGAYGSKSKATAALKGGHLLFRAPSLKAYQGLTVAAQYPEDTARAPSLQKRVSWYLGDAITVGKALPWMDIPYYALMVFFGLFSVVFGRRSPSIGSGGGGFSGGGAGGGGGGSW